MYFYITVVLNSHPAADASHIVLSVHLEQSSAHVFSTQEVSTYLHPILLILLKNLYIYNIKIWLTAGKELST